jgi:hypothetical protein
MQLGAPEEVRESKINIYEPVFNILINDNLEEF